jgi:hypothetical protein
MRTVAIVVKPEEAHLLRAHLAGCGVKAHVRDDVTVGMDWAIGLAIGGVKVDVADEDYEQAREILGETAVEPEPLASKRRPGLGRYVAIFLATAVVTFAAFAIRLDVASRVALAIDVGISLAVAAVVTFLCAVRDV